MLSRIRCRTTLELDVRQQLKNDQIFSAPQHMLEWIRMVASKLGFGVVIGMFDTGTSRRKAFVTMRCERSGKYVLKIRKLKHDDTGSRKCECPFKLHGYCWVDDIWWFNVIYCIHNHMLYTKLQGHPIVCRLKPEEKEIISKMSIIKVMPRNM
ncbi:uncharacterized protein LOC131650245 [Vicia villosa]|uniref:uncharacterized protein LOC131650245 n=1 Tax=Vicia villosa TaxID=3911 RepID=UPI00273B93AE|nr:uncharacterized protein LOC131650245 [Vicia villosa]